MPSLPNHSNRRQWLQAMGATALGSSLALPTWAQGGYPSKPIRLIVPLPAGGPADAAARIQAQALEKVLKQPVIVDNKPGGSYVVGMNAMAAAPADGYTLMALNVSMCSTQVTLGKLNLLKSLVPVSRMAETPAILVGSGKGPYKTVADLVAYGKANPGRLSYGVGGAGSAEHLLSVYMEQQAGFSSTVVPYKGAIDGVTGLVQGDIHYQVVPLPLAVQFIPKGIMRPLAVFSEKRLKEFPDVPTMAEAGVPMSPFTYWTGLAAAADTPPDIVQTLFKAIHEVNANPEVNAKLAGIGASVSSSESPQAFVKEISGDLERMAAAVKAGNIQLVQ